MGERLAVKLSLDILARAHQGDLAFSPFREFWVCKLRRTGDYFCKDKKYKGSASLLRMLKTQASP